MAWSFSLGRLLGSELRVHVTFFLLLAWIGFAAYGTSGWAGALVNIAFVLALFACVVAHEFGHALMARRYGIRTPDITLLPIGGLARLERMPEKPGQEIAVALAGPAVNVAIWAVLTAFGAKTSLALTDLDQTTTGFLQRLAVVNLFLALFNMIPAFPMDGGRVLRALLCLRMDRVAATRAAATAGQIVAFFLGFMGLSSGNPVLVLIAVFVFVAANAESQDVAMRSVARRLMAAVEAAAFAQGRTLLVLDTRTGDAAEKLYGALGYEIAGVIPGFARHPAEDRWEGATFMYKTLV